MARNVGKMLASRIQESRSPLYTWLATHYDEIAPLVARSPHWEAIAQTARDDGVTTAKGSLTREAVRKSWHRVVEDREASATAPPRPVPKKAAAAAGEPAATIPAARPAVLPLPANPYGFKPASLKKHPTDEGT